MSRPLHVDADLVLVPHSQPGGEESASPRKARAVTLRGEGRTLRLAAPALSDMEALMGSIPGGGSPLAFLRQVSTWLARADLRVEARLGSRLLFALEPRRRTLAGRILRIPGFILPLRSIPGALRLRG
ncbi:MAG: hypothetical protein EA350_12980 [Gemmatimonadales bacterium]|nr:MAG: hypothetical protein EA350_12980 [Gemmatimonadales bacterium]